MFCKILILVTFVLVILTTIIIEVWRKLYFVKYVYIERSAYISLYIVNISVLIFIGAFYFLGKETNDNNEEYLYIMLSVNIIVHFLYMYLSTLCVYLSKNYIIKKSIFFTKKTSINENTEIHTTVFERIVVTNNKKMIISVRYLSGDIERLFNELKLMIEKA